MIKEQLYFWIKVYPLYLFIKWCGNFVIFRSFLQSFYVKRLFKYAKEHCLYYSKIIEFNNIECSGIKDIEKFPFLTKKCIQDNLNDIISDEIGKDYPVWANTGGSTGEPLSFPRKFFNTPFEAVHSLFLYKQMNWSYNELIISIDGSRVPENLQKKNIFWIVGKNFPYGKFSLSTLYMSDLTLKYYVDFLNLMKPSVLRGYPSGLMEIYIYMKKNNIQPTFQLKGIYLTSERVTSYDRSSLESFFNCNVWGQYGHTESSIYAISKPNQDSYLASPFYGYTEIIGLDNKHVSVGCTGEVVVTGFSMCGIPFIRYRTGDLAIYGGEKKGWTVLSSLEGRSVDYIVNKKDEKIFLTGFIFGGHLHAFNYITNWQIKQDEIGKVEILIVVSDDWQPSFEIELIDIFNSVLVDVKIHYVNLIEKSKRGKQNFMIQNLKS